jgi:hypothetical protein
MNASNPNTEEKLAIVSWAWVKQPTSSYAASSLLSNPKPGFDWLLPIRNWLDSIEVSQPQLAHRICRSIPSQCPFERDVKLFGYKLFHIPPLCKLNPVYEQVVALRFRALCYLADVCGEDISQYC